MVPRVMNVMRHILMFAISLIMLILSLLDFELTLQDKLIIFGALSIILLNLRILYSGLGYFVIILPLVSTISLLLVYVRIIGYELLLELTYTVLFVFMVLLFSRKVNMELDLVINRLYNKKMASAEKIFMLLLLLLAYILLLFHNNTFPVNISYYITYLVVGPLIEGIFLCIDYLSAIDTVNSIRNDFLVFNILYLSTILYYSPLYIIASIVGNLSKNILGFKWGLLVDYTARSLIIAGLALGVV